MSYREAGKLLVEKNSVWVRMEFAWSDRGRQKDIIVDTLSPDWKHNCFVVLNRLHTVQMGIRKKVKSSR